jgi:hypothetical protein
MSIDEMMAADPFAAAPSPPLGSPGGDPSAASPAPGTNDAGDAGPGGAQVNDLENIQVGGNMSIFNNAIHILEAQRRTRVRQFTLADGRTVTETEEHWAVEHFTGVEGEADALLRHLEERRVLLLSGESGARKVTAATHLAMRLRERSLCRHPAYVVGAVDRHVHVDFPRIPEKHEELRDRVVVFRYALSRGNPDLANAFAKTDRAGWARLADELRARNAFLVFTATPAETEQFLKCHGFGGVHHALSPHPPPELARRLAGYLGTLRERGEASPEVVAALEGFGDRLVRRFRFAPQLTDFVSFFVGLGQPDLGFDEAHALFHDTNKRLLHDLDDDFDGWSFGFTLALAQCVPDADGVPWVDFDRLRRHLRRWLQRDLQITAAPRDGEDEAESSEVRLELSDDTLFTRSRARVEKDPVTLADVIRSCDGRPPESVWRDLLGHHRRVLTAILPRLRELAERPGLEGRSIGVLAAQVIGRIGEMDYERIVVPMAERWAVSGNGQHRGLVGAMFEGVLGSEDARYRARCLAHLRGMHAGGPAAAGKGRVEAAIGAYTWVGWHDFALAMDELYAIARAYLVPSIEDATRLAQLVTGIQANLQKAAGKNDKAARALQEVLRSLVDRIYEEQGDIFIGVQYALVALCAARGPTPVLRALRGWIGRGGASTGVLVALMFMHERGIANQLREDAVEFSQGEGLPPATCGQFVRALAGGEEDVFQAARFLGELYDSVTSPWAAEALVRRHFREQLKVHLLGWVREALPVPELAAAVRAFVEQLARTHRGALRDVIVSLVSGGEFVRKPDMQEFAASLQL